MNVDRSPMWIGLADLLLCILSVGTVAVAPTKAKVEGANPKAGFLIAADWPVALDSEANTIPARIEITGLNPQVTTLFAGNVALDPVGRTINGARFDLARDGQIKLTDHPLEPIAHADPRDKP
jgi:hypothetical protein